MLQNKMNIKISYFPGSFLQEICWACKMLSAEEFQSVRSLLNQFPGSHSLAVDLVDYQFEEELRKVKEDEYSKKVHHLIRNRKATDDEDAASGTVDFCDSFYDIVKYLHDLIQKYKSMYPVDKRGQSGNLKNQAFKMNMLLRATIFNNIDESLSKAVARYCSKVFGSYVRWSVKRYDSGRKSGTLDEAFVAMQERTGVMDALNYFLISIDDKIQSNADVHARCGGCGKENHKCMCWSINDKFRQVTEMLADMNLLDLFIGNNLKAVICELFQASVQRLPKLYDRPYWEDLKIWYNVFVQRWLQEFVFVTNDQANDLCVFRCEQIFDEIQSIYGSWLISNMFDMLIQFPSSEPMIDDLKRCLAQTPERLRDSLVKETQRQIDKRLLHPGVGTVEIITLYIQAIRAFRRLDPSGVLLERCCTSIRSYLRQRSDTIRCIVSYLTEPSDDDLNLSLELAGNESLLLDDAMDWDADVDEEDWHTWEPDPVDADPTKNSRSRRYADIVSMLVGIYGSKELFVKEYCQLLSERLLRTFQNDIDKEVRYLELLKKRFGEQDLQNCEVMIKDVRDSLRTDRYVSTDSAAKQNILTNCSVNSLILSSHFWPNLREEKYRLPEIVFDSLAEYRRSYEKLKGSRTIEWRQSYGFAVIELEIDGMALQYKVSPILATIIMKFQEKEEWDLEELGAALEISASALKRRISYWQIQGIVYEDVATGKFRLCSHLPESLEISSDRLHVFDEDELEESLAGVSQADRSEDLETYWHYLRGVFRNLGGLSLERVFAMLKMLFSTDEQSLEIEHVQRFLEKKVKEQELMFAGGVYKLPSTTSRI